MVSGGFSPSRRAGAILEGVRRLAALSILLLLGAGCGHLAYADGPYRGRVLDADTKQPITGAAVLAVWWKRSPGPGHPIISFYDAQETVTDNDGNFTIPGISGGSLNPLARMEDPLFTIFKPEYEAYGDRRPARPANQETALIELRLLPTRQAGIRNLDRLFVASDVPEAKYSNLIRLINIERVRLGLRPTGPPTEKRQ